MYQNHQRGSLQSHIEHAVRRYYSRRKLNEQDYQHYVQDVWVRACSSKTLPLLLEEIQKECDRYANAATNSNRHSVSEKQNSNVHKNEQENTKRRRIWTETNWNYDDLESSYEKYNILLNLYTGTSKEPDLGIPTGKPKRDSKNFWPRAFPNLYCGRLALEAINPELVFTPLDSDYFVESMQLKGDIQKYGNCPICTGRGCFTIRMNESGWISCKCFNKRTHLRNPAPTNKKRRHNTLKNLFNLFLNCHFDDTRNELLKVLERELPNSNSNF